MNVTVFRETRAILGESLVWDATDGGAMLWCDITAGLIHRSPLMAPADGSGDTVIALPAPVGSFHPCDLGGFIVSLGDRVVVVDAAGSITREVARIPHSREGLRLNEGKVDPAGRWVTGSLCKRRSIDTAASWPCATAVMMFLGPKAASPPKNTCGRLA